MDGPELAQIGQDPSVFLLPFVFRHPSAQLVPAADHHYLGLAFIRLQKLNQLVFEVVLLRGRVYHEQPLETVGVGGCYSEHAAVEELEIGEVDLFLLEINDEVPLLDDSPDHHVLLQGLQQIGSSRKVVVGRVPFKVDQGGFQNDIGAVLIVPPVAVYVSVLQDLPGRFLQFGYQLVLVPLVVHLHFLSYLGDHEVPGVGQPQQQLLGVVHQRFFLTEDFLYFGDML